ncbi:RNA polymerase sigma-70 factor (sigma-E family) [Nocardioides ginsengisegetis]|uniref:RNA polymerase sigma-70 factor (Sigma-E family) n=1 Tax=Nocardioides ginsengisegetis TaxID=661491 RepID=A0A7W3J0U1_9ACTN|nr:SigE family RNA polymerase sigma factor [Nocardioides ginsengisegetis]MBA8804246.1 RNA polymerase sigma-70 factor (sigma-E family) [Nocardioides ginsengisegetis]
MPHLPGRPPSDDDYTEFVHASWSSLYRTAYLLLGDHAEAEDLVQTALAKTYASWRQVRDLSAAPGYARTTLVNTATSWFRKKSWRNERPSEELPEQVVHHDPSDRPALVTALGELPPRQRAVVVLRFYEDLSVAQTAHALGCSEGTVKSQTSDALARLRTLLGDAVVPHTLGALHD